MKYVNDLKCGYVVLVGIIVFITVLEKNKPKPMPERLLVRGGQETMYYNGQATGTVSSVKMLPDTPTGCSFPVVEVCMAKDNDASAKVIWVAYIMQGVRELKVGDKVLVTTVTYQSVVGAVNNRFVSKFE